MAYGWRPHEDPTAAPAEPPVSAAEASPPSHEEPQEEPMSPLPGVDEVGWNEKVHTSTTTREKVLTSEEAKALGME